MLVLPVGLALEAEQQLRGVPGEFRDACRRPRPSVPGVVGSMTGRIFHSVARRRGVLQHVDAAAARRPLVVRVVDVDAGVGMPLDEQQRGVQQLDHVLLHVGHRREGLRSRISSGGDGRRENGLKKKAAKTKPIETLPADGVNLGVRK